jgi:hypothetical protein
MTMVHCPCVDRLPMTGHRPPGPPVQGSSLLSFSGFESC